MSKQYEVDPGKLPESLAPRVDPGVIKPPEKFRFSLEHWREIKNFELGGCNVQWFQSLLERLRSLSGEPLSRFQDEPEFRGVINFHEIDWHGKNVKYRREDFDWLPSHILNDEATYPFYQINISLANGRIHGFWDAKGYFSIFLIDPMHNLQPSRYNAHKIRKTRASICQYSSLRISLDKAVDHHCTGTDCAFFKYVQQIDHHQSYNGDWLILAAVSEDVYRHLCDYSRQNAISVSEIVSYGIVFLKEQK